MDWDSASFGAALKQLDGPHALPGSIRKACAAVEDCIASNKDNLRGFFEFCFPVLLKRVFGYDDVEASWLNLVTKPGRDDDARALMQLLSPQGALFGAMRAADADRLIHFLFPPERLPGHTQELLQTSGGRAELDRWPQYAGRLRTDAAGRAQVTLNMFDYFVFWAAFYVLRGSRGADAGRQDPYPPPAPAASGRARAGALYENVRSYGANILSSIGTQFTGSNMPKHPYFRVLRTYLDYALPRPGGANGAGGGRSGGGGADAAAGGGARGGGGATGGGLLGASRLGGSTAAGGGGAGAGEVLLSVLLEFWFTDAAEPIPPDPPAGSRAVSPSGGSGGGAAAAVAAVVPRMSGGGGGGSGGMGGAVGAAAPLRAYSYLPPSEEHVQAMTALVKYIYALEPPSPDQPAAPAQSGRSAWLPPSPVQTYPLPQGRLTVPLHAPLVPAASAAPETQAVARKLYRFLRRAFTQWQPTTSASMTPILKLWLVVLCPWQAVTYEDTLIAKGVTGGVTGGVPGVTRPGGSAQQVHQLASQATAALGRLGSGLAHLGAAGGAAGGAGGSGAGGAEGERPSGVKGAYGPQWRGHVLSHLPFYTVLLPQFIELCYTRMAYRADAAVRDVYRIMREFADAPDLVKDLQAAEKAFNSYAASSPRRADGEYADILPWLLDQAADFETAAAAGAPTTPPIAPIGGAAAAGGSAGGAGVAAAPPLRLRLFSRERGGTASCARALLRAAEAQSVNTQLRTAARECIERVLPVASLPDEEATMAAPGAADVGDLPRAGHWQSLRYKGDWMLRPIATNEVAWLSRLLISLSQSLNTALGLDGIPLAQKQAAAAAAAVAAASAAAASSSSAGEAQAAAAAAAAAAQVEPPETLLQEWLLAAKRRGWRVNLRPLAEKQTLAWTVAAAFLLYWLTAAIAAALFAPPAAAVAPGGGWWSGGGEGGVYEGQYSQQYHETQGRQNEGRFQWEPPEAAAAEDLGW